MPVLFRVKVSGITDVRVHKMTSTRRVARTGNAAKIVRVNGTMLKTSQFNKFKLPPSPIRLISLITDRYSVYAKTAKYIV